MAADDKPKKKDSGQSADSSRKSSSRPSGSSAGSKRPQGKPSSPSRSSGNKPRSSGDKPPGARGPKPQASDKRSSERGGKPSGGKASGHRSSSSTKSAGGSRPPTSGKSTSSSRPASGGRPGTSGSTGGSTRQTSTGGKPSGSRPSSGSRPTSGGRPSGSRSGGTPSSGGSRPPTRSPRPDDRRDQRAPRDRSDRPRDDRPRDDRPRIPAGPPIPDDVTGRELDRAVRAELSGLAVGTATDVARNLVMVARLLDDDPDQAYLYAKTVRALSQRLAVAREAMGLAAYHRGLWAEARSELRAFQRMSGSQEHLAIIADCERGLGRAPISVSPRLLS